MVKINQLISQLKSIKAKETLSNCNTTTETFVWTVMELRSSFDRLIVLEPDCTLIGCIFYFRVARNQLYVFFCINFNYCFCCTLFLLVQNQQYKFEFSFTKLYFSLLSSICIDSSSSINRGKIFFQETACVVHLNEGYLDLPLIITYCPFISGYLLI